MGLVLALGCGSDAKGPNDSDGATPGEGQDDGGLGDASGPGEGEDASASADGGVEGADAAATTDADGHGHSDGGSSDANPLEQPLPDFCAGTGAVVVVGEGDACSGDIAESTFRFGLCACDTIEVGSTLSIDSFDSTEGVYGGTNIGGDGNLGINGALSAGGKATIGGSAFVSGGGFSVGPSSAVAGNLYANGDARQNNSSCSVGRNMFVNGNVEGSFVVAGDLRVPVGASVSDATRQSLGGQLIEGPIPAVVPCPCGPDEVLDISRITRWARDHNDNAVNDVLTSTAWENGGPTTIELPCGRYYLTRIHQGSSGLTIRATGRTVLYVDGDLRVGGGLNLEIDPGAEIDLFVAGDVSVGAALRFGTESAPSAVRTYTSGTGTVAISASSIFGGNLYAPFARIDFNASTTIYGALFARSVRFQASANVHFDSAVRRAGQACIPPGGGSDGGVEADGGSDAGTAEDGGTDAGTSDAGDDAGTVECRDGCGCTSGLGCSDGVCQPCVSDLDCCAPFTCSSSGRCSPHL